MRHLTADLPGTGGRVKTEPEDFRVEEVPLYEPSGRGDHVYLYVEKRGIPSLKAADRIARALGSSRRRVGLAGLKDARAVTRQWMSLEGVDPGEAARLNLPGVRILAVSRHRNKLKIGHLARNRFEVRIRGCEEGSLGRARTVLEVLQARGMPNGFDRQRFGRRGDSHLLGRALVRGEAREFCDRFLGRPGEADSPQSAEARRLYDAGDLEAARDRFGGDQDRRRVLSALIRTGDPERAARSLPKQLARLFVSACQSDLFNAILDRRLEELDRLEAGDLAYIHAKGAVFSVEDPACEQPRADAFEISPSGPMVGHRVKLASGRPGEIERTVLEEKGVFPEDFERVKGLRLRGARRPLRVPVEDVHIELDEPAASTGSRTDLKLAFTLPPGAYATILLAEVTKAEQEANA